MDHGNKSSTFPRFLFSTEKNISFTVGVFIAEICHIMFSGLQWSFILKYNLIQIMNWKADSGSRVIINNNKRAMVWGGGQRQIAIWKAWVSNFQKYSQPEASFRMRITHHFLRIYVSVLLKSWIVRFFKVYFN